MRPVSILYLGAALLSGNAYAATVTCTCNNVYDDTPCLQGILNSSGSADFSASQTCRTTGTLYLSGGAALNGNGATLNATLANGGDGIQIYGSGATISGLNLNYTSRTGGGTVIDINANVTGGTITGNTINGNGAWEAILSHSVNTRDITISKNYISNAAYGVLVIGIGLGTTLSNYQSGWTITGNTFRNITGDGIELDSNGTGGSGLALNNMAVTYNDIEASGSTWAGAGFCIGVAGAMNLLVANNTMGACKWQCIHVEDYASGNTFRDNICKGTIGPRPSDYSSYSQGDSAGMIFLWTTHDNNILGNIINNAAGTGLEFTWDGTPSDYTYNNTISGNQINNSGAVGILIGGESSQNVNTTVGPSNGYGGNVTSNSAVPGNESRQGSIWNAQGRNVTISGNSGN
jgi:hypothetical protein